MCIRDSLKVCLDFLSMLLSLMLDSPTDLVTDILPLSQTDTKKSKRAMTNLDNAYSHLGGNAFGRDKKGRLTKDDSTMSTEISTIGGAGAEHYNAYVLYEFEIA